LFSKTARKEHGTPRIKNAYVNSTTPNQNESPRICEGFDPRNASATQNTTTPNTNLPQVFKACPNAQTHEIHVKISRELFRDGLLSATAPILAS
jgi:hypothetical protein